MPRILFLITGLSYAGAENQLVQLCKGLKPKGCEIAVVSMTSPKAHVDELTELGVEVHTLNMSRGIPDPRGILRLRRIISRFKPDVVHSHLVHANILARVARLFIRMPLLICTAHTRNEEGKIRELLYRLTDPLCELTTNVSQDAVNHYIQEKIVPRHKIQFIPNGIDVSRYHKQDTRNKTRETLGLAEQQFTWLAAGRFVPAKDYRNLVTAFRRVADLHPDSLLLIAGIGPEREEIEELCKTLGLQEHISFLGLRKDIPELMQAADAYVMSSRWEGMPIVLLEAAASGLPIVATDVGGNREVVQDGVTGLLVPAEDSWALGEQMLALMEKSPEDRQRMGEQGREYVQQHYTMDVVIDQWLSLYALQGLPQMRRKKHD